MKKCIILLTALLLLLSGCDNAKPQPPEPSQPAAVSSETSTAPPQPKQEQPQNLTFIQTYQGSGNENGYYRLVDKEINNGDSLQTNILYMDYQTKQEVYLCNKPECTHSDDSCTSFVPWGDYEAKSLFCYGGKLYLIPSPGGVSVNSLGGGDESGQMEFPKPAILQMNLDGSGRTKLYEFASGSNSDFPYLISDDALYLTTFTPKQNVSGDGTISMSNENPQLVKIDLKTREMKTICPLVSGNEELKPIGAFDGQMILLKSIYPKPMAEIDVYNDSAYFANLRAATLEFVTMDVKTGEQKSLYRCGFKEAQSTVTDGNNVFFIADKTKTIQVLDAATGQVSTLTDSLPSEIRTLPEKLNGGKIVITNLSEDGETVADSFAVDAQTGEITKLNIRQSSQKSPVEIYEETKDSFLVLSDQQYKEEYVPQLGRTQTVLVNTQYSLILKEDYWNSRPNYNQIQSAKQEG